MKREKKAKAAPRQKREKTSKTKTPRKSRKKTDSSAAPSTTALVPVVCDEQPRQAPPQATTTLVSVVYHEQPRQAPPQRTPRSDVVVKNEAEALFYFAQIDSRLAEAWKRDVVMHEGPITIRFTLPSWFDSTHYAYVDPRLIWYLKHDPSDPLGARWEGYLREASDAPRGSMVVMVGRDIRAKKCGPQIEEAPR